MRYNRHVLKSIAVILLLVFGQKMGAGLFLHNYLHLNNCKQPVPSGVATVTGYNCTCVDDFSMPLVTSVEPSFEKIAQPQIEFVLFFSSFVPGNSPVHQSLRGPPSFS